MSKAMRIAWLFMHLSFVTSVVASGAAAQPYSMNGTWNTNDERESGTWSVVFNVSERDAEGRATLVDGTASVTGMPGVTRGQVVGSLRGGTLQFGILYESVEVVTFSGVGQNDSFGGTFSTPEALSGVWHGALVQASAAP